MELPRHEVHPSNACNFILSWHPFLSSRCEVITPLLFIHYSAILMKRLRKICAEFADIRQSLIRLLR